MENKYYESQLKKLEEVTHLSAEKQNVFTANILLVSASILGILISLHSNSSEWLCVKISFVLAIVLLALGILTTAVLLYDRTMLIERTRQKFVKEAITASKEDRPLNQVCVDEKKRTVLCRKISYISLLLGLLMLVVFATLSTFLE